MPYRTVYLPPDVEARLKELRRLAALAPNEMARVLLVLLLGRSAADSSERNMQHPPLGGWVLHVALLQRCAQQCCAVALLEEVTQ